MLFAQADCLHPRGQGTVDVIVTGTAGEATESLLNDVRKAVAQIAGPYDNILVKSSVTVPQDIAVTVTVSNAPDNSQIENRVRSILTGLLAVRKGRRLHELTCSDINLAIRSGCDTVTNAVVTVPDADVRLSRDKVIISGVISVTVERS